MSILHSIEGMYHILFIHASFDGYLGCFYFGAIMDNAAMNFHVQVFVWTCAFISLYYVPESGTGWSYGNAMMFKHLRNSF